MNRSDQETDVGIGYGLESGQTNAHIASTKDMGSSRLQLTQEWLGLGVELVTQFGFIVDIYISPTVFVQSCYILCSYNVTRRNLT